MTSAKATLRRIINKRIGTCLLILLLCLTQFTSQAKADPPQKPRSGASQQQQDAFSSGVYTFDVAGGGACNGSIDSAGSVTTGGPPEASTIDEVKTFASEPITSTWDIPEGTAEQWYLKQTNNLSRDARYNVNSDNIGQITAAVKAANVSPIFFYLYATNEGDGIRAGAGGFINHFKASEESGDAVKDAAKDAEYLVSYSQKTDGHPATGGGEPSDMPTAEAKQIYDALPSGSIGKVYIQATAAVTAELEDLSGKTGDWSGKYNKPLSDAMHNIKTMGGDPQQGGASISTDDCTDSTTVAGTGMTKGINFAIAIAKNDGYGYDQGVNLSPAGRTTGWLKWQSDPSCTSQCGSFDCSSLISAIVTVAGYFKTNPEFATYTEGSELEQHGFKKVADSAHTSAGLQPGDILLAGEHTELYIGNNQDVGAHWNENKGIDGGEVGDQVGGHTTNSEIGITPFYDDNWIGVYRAQN